MVAGLDRTPIGVEFVVQKRLGEESQEIAAPDKRAQGFPVYVMLFPGDFGVVVALKELTDDHFDASARPSELARSTRIPASTGLLLELVGVKHQACMSPDKW